MTTTTVRKCHTCLSTDREITVLGHLEAIYRQICPTNYGDVHSGVQLCWECKALLRNVKSFQIKAKNALKAFNNNFPKTLSNLCIESVVEESYPNPVKIETEHNLALESNLDNKQKYEIDQKCENEQAIKVENENIDDIEYKDDCDENFDDSFDYAPIEEIKDENLPETVLKQLQEITVKKIKSKKPKIEPADRTKRYKMTHRKLDNAVIKVPIDEKDVETWKEKERNSMFYKKLKRKCTKCVSRVDGLSMKEHNRKYHSEAKYMQFRCHICEQNFLRNTQLSRHLESHYHYRRCAICDYTCYNRLNMIHHLQQHSRIVKCLECEGIFSNTRKFFDHYKAAHKVFICAYCNKRYNAKDMLVRHIFRWHTPHKCNQCNVTFSAYRSYLEHNKLKHLIERSEATFCVQCNMQFDTVPLFRRHINYSVAHSHERKATPKQSSVKCPECPNVYARKTSMMNHYRFVHLKQTKHYCELCQRWFLNSTRLIEHVKIKHERRQKERSKICYVCGRGFYEKRILINHLRTHTGERPFECELCDARFTQKVALDSHVKFIHLKNKRKPDGTNRITSANQLN